MNKSNYKTAMWFIVLLGFVSLFADMAYESARSIAGSYLAILGASGMIVGMTAGTGELLGYGLRVLSGLLSDKTQRYWMITIIGYTINLIAVPLLGLAGHWQSAVVLLMTERIGKAIRSPARDVLLSHAAGVVGRGWGFALHEAMDQIGAMTGPVIVMIVLAISGSYRCAFAVLAIPAVLALAVLTMARNTYPRPHELEVGSEEHPHPRKMADKLPKVFWIYLTAVGLVAAGFADYPLVAFHIKSHNIFADKWIPLLYAFAMGVDALAALAFGKMYDKKGMFALAMAIAFSSVFAIFAFSSSSAMIIGGVALWGVGMGAQESIIRAAVADIVPKDRRGSGFGIFNAGYGIAWFVGSSIMGILYDFSIGAVIAFSVVSQLASLPILLSIRKQLNHK